VSERGEPVKWRAHFNQLISRPIPKKAIPKLIAKMIEDGLYCELTIDGYQWYSGRYRVHPISIREIWSLSRSQWQRVMDYIYEENPFEGIGEEDDE
tara:strand:- start:8925 stop:9212 length:288 start_codon:yes stop_codon:yes gene_type:complete